VKEVLQVSAYAELLRECLGIEVQGVLIMHHPAEGAAKVVPVEKPDLARGLEAFKLVRDLYGALAPLANVIPQPPRWQPRRAS
jgi:hypothetical protein